MATFEQRVEGLTGLAITGSSNPTQTELTEFLKEGAIDVITRYIQVRPSEARLFSTTLTANDASGIDLSDYGRVLSVTRENGSNDITRMCSLMLAEHAHLATLKSSLYFKTAYNPGYYVENNILYVLPAPSSATTESRASVVAYPNPLFSDSSLSISNKIVTNATCTNADGSVFTSNGHPFVDGDVVKLYNFNEATELNNMKNLVVHSKSTNTFELKGISADPAETTGGTVESVSSPFPVKMEYLVIIYAAIKALQNALADKNYPKVGGAIEELTGTMDADSAGYSTQADFLDFSKWFSVAGEFIEEEEDSELAQMQLGKINSYIQAWSAQMQGNTNEYTWMDARMKIIQSQYDNAFMVIGGQVPNQGQEEPRRRRRRR